MVLPRLVSMLMLTAGSVLFSAQGFAQGQGHAHEGHGTPAAAKMDEAPGHHGDGHATHGTGHGAGHRAGGDSTHDHSRTLDLPRDEAPTLALGLRAAPEGKYVLSLFTQRLAFSEEHADGPHIAGEGHAHWYVNGKKIGRLYDPENPIGPFPPGTHEIRVGLYTNDHAGYSADGVPVEARYVITIAKSGRAPGAGPVSTKEVRLEAGKAAPATLRLTQGEMVELRWTGTEAANLHLHGYDIQFALVPGTVTTVRFFAKLAGRFPVAKHGHGAGAHGHQAVGYVEVHPK